MIVNDEIGRNGRFGNQVLQYGFLACYVQEYGGEFANCPWDGDEIFNVQPGRAGLPDLPLITENSDNPAICPIRNGMGRLKDHKVSGYFQDQTGLFSRNVDLMKSHFSFKGAAAEQDAELEAALAKCKGPIVVLHLRRGDYGTGFFFLTPHLWVMLCLIDLKEKYGEFTLVITSDDTRKLLSIYTEYNPLFGTDLVQRDDTPGFLLDWQIQRRADVLLMSNSSFSFTAGLLSDKPDQIRFRPSLIEGGFMPCNPEIETAVLRDGIAEEYGPLFMSEKARRKTKYRLGRLFRRYPFDTCLSGQVDLGNTVR